MDKYLAMTIIEVLGEKICELNESVKSLQDYCKYSDERCETLIKRIHELEGFDSEKVRAECEEIVNGEDSVPYDRTAITERS